MRGGGHNVAGKAVTDGGVMIDLAPMRDIAVDPATARCVRSPGHLGRVQRRAAAHGLATTGGVVSTTGIAGLTLGGGFGWLMGKHGTGHRQPRFGRGRHRGRRGPHRAAKRRTRTCSGDPGGGGNFGVATSFEFRRPVGTSRWVILSPPRWPPLPVSSTPSVASPADAPDDVGASCGLVHALDGSGTKIVAPPAVSRLRRPPEGRRRHQGLSCNFGPPVFDTVEVMPYPVVNTLLDDAFPKGAVNYWKSAFLTELSDDAIAIFLDAYKPTCRRQ